MTGNKKLTNINSNIMHVIRVLAAWAVLVGHSLSYYSLSIFKDETYFPYIQNFGLE